MGWMLCLCSMGGPSRIMHLIQRQNRLLCRRHQTREVFAAYWSILISIRLCSSHRFHIQSPTGVLARNFKYQLAISMQCFWSYIVLTPAYLYCIRSANLDWCAATRSNLLTTESSGQGIQKLNSVFDHHDVYLTSTDRSTLHYETTPIILIYSGIFIVREPRLRLAVRLDNSAFSRLSATSCLRLLALLSSDAFETPVGPFSNSAEGPCPMLDVVLWKWSRSALIMNGSIPLVSSGMGRLIWWGKSSSDHWDSCWLPWVSLLLVTLCDCRSCAWPETTGSKGCGLHVCGIVAVIGIGITCCISPWLTWTSKDRWDVTPDDCHQFCRRHRVVQTCQNIRIFYAL